MMPAEPTFETLQSLGFRLDEDEFSALCKHAGKARMSFVQGMEQLLAIERRARDGRNLARRLRHATLGTVPPIDAFDWNHPRSIDRDRYEALTKPDFANKAQNVLLRGPSGVGKTTLAQNLGLAAIQAGMTVRMVSFPTLSHQAISHLFHQPDGVISHITGLGERFLEGRIMREAVGGLG